MQRKLANSWAGDNEDEEKESHILNSGFLWSKAATSLRRCVHGCGGGARSGGIVT